MHLGSGPSFTQRLELWVAEARVDDAAAGRARERWLGEVAGQEATVSGVLADLAERQATVAVRTAAGRRHRGTVRMIGADFVVMGTDGGTELALTLTALSELRSLGRTDVLGDRMIGTELRLADVLAELAADRADVSVVTTSGDVMALRLGEPVTVVHVPLAAVTEVRLG